MMLLWVSFHKLKWVDEDDGPQLRCPTNDFLSIGSRFVITLEMTGLKENVNETEMQKLFFVPIMLSHPCNNIVTQYSSAPSDHLIPLVKTKIMTHSHLFQKTWHSMSSQFSWFFIRNFYHGFSSSFRMLPFCAIVLFYAKVMDMVLLNSIVISSFWSTSTVETN